LVSPPKVKKLGDPVVFHLDSYNFWLNIL